MRYKLFIIIILLIPVGCKQASRQEVQQSIPKVDTAIAKMVSTSAPIYASGIIKATQNLKKSFKISGIIDNVYVEAGEKVKPGDMLAKIKTTEIDASVDQARLAVEKARRDFSRVDNLYRDSVATKEQWQNARTALNIALSDLQRATFNQKHARITAHHKAIVLKRLAEPGEMIAAGHPLLILAVKNKKYSVSVSVTDREWVDIQMGDSASVQINAFPNQYFAAKVSQIGAMAEAKTGTYELKLQLLEEPHKAGTGMMAEAFIYPKNKKKQIRIPIDALLQAHNREGYVYLLQKNNTVVKKTIRIDRLTDQYLYINKGLKENDILITQGKNYLSEGKKVKINR